MFKKLLNNKKKEERNLTKERDERCIPLVHEIQQMIVEGNLLVACTDATKVAENYNKITLKILARFEEVNLPVEDGDYIFRLLLEAQDRVTQFVSESVNKSVDIATDKLWGKEQKDVTFQDVDEILKKEVE